MPLNADEWHRELRHFLGSHEEFDDYDLMFIDDESLPDKLVFRVEEFSGSIGSDAWTAIRNYGSVVDMKLGSNAASRVNNVTLVVTEPNDNVMAALYRHTAYQYSILGAKVWSPRIILVAILISAALLAHSSSLLHAHWHEHEQPMEGMLHFVVHHAALLWPFQSTLAAEAVASVRAAGEAIVH